MDEKDHSTDADNNWNLNRKNHFVGCNCNMISIYTLQHNNIRLYSKPTRQYLIIFKAKFQLELR